MARKKNHKHTGIGTSGDTKKILRFLFAIGCLLLLYDFYRTRIGFSGELERYAYGEGEYEEELSYQVTDSSGELTVEVDEQQPDESEAKEYLNDAIAEIDATFLGDNESVDHVTSDVCLQDTYVDGMVDATWSLSDYDIVTSSGEILSENLKEDTMVTATATLSCGTYESVYEFPFCICLPEEGSAASNRLLLQKAISSDLGEGETLILPTTVGDRPVTWKRKMDFRGLILILLAIGMYVLYPKMQAFDAHRKKKEREEQLRIDYPAILGQLSLLLQVGISLPEALSRMHLRYDKKLSTGMKRRPGFDGILTLEREIKDGRGTYEALEHLGRNGREYKKLALLLEQMGQRGGDHLIAQLQKEEADAFEMRKTAAKRLGEEASTKLLLPMMGMLAIILVVLLVPALLMVQNS